MCKGGARIIYKGQMPNEEEVAMKRLSGIGRCSNMKMGFLQRSRCRIFHPHIVRLFGFCSNQDKNILVYEYIYSYMNVKSLRK